MKAVGLMFAALCVGGCTGQETSSEVVGAATLALVDGGSRSDPDGGSTTGGPPRAASVNYQFRGASAEAYFNGYGADGCSWWSAAVYAGENVQHAVSGRPVSSAYSYAYVSSYNYCSGASFGGWGSTDSAAIDNLSGAQLSVPITLSSVTCAWVECELGSTDPRCAAPPRCDPMMDPYCYPPCDPRRDPSCCDPAVDPSCVPPPPPPPVGYMDCTYSEQTGDFVATLTGEGDVTRGMYMNSYSSGRYRSVSRNTGSTRSASVVGSLVIDGHDFLAGASGYGMLSDNANSSHTFYRY